MKKIIIVTGGAGFVGSNMISFLLKKTKFKIISIDNYSSGSKKNHLKNKRVRYIKSNIKDISKKLDKYKNNINSLFHFGEFARIYQSFLKIDECISSNTIGSYEVFKFCLRNNIKLIYSATSATIGDNGNNKNLSPYAFTKSRNLELLENLKRWYRFKYEIVYFYNVYGPNQICTGSMATVVGIFENQYKENRPLTIVRPGTQSRRFTYIDDTIQTCYLAWKKNMCRHYSISNKKSYTITQVAKLFKSKIKFLPSRSGERYVSKLTNKNLSNKVYKIYGKTMLVDYINRRKKELKK
jgi:UDP-glucose 4-epimerase